MHRLDLVKLDGRALYLYAPDYLPSVAYAPSPSSEPVDKSGSHLRWHPLRAEWVAYAALREDRTFLPPKEFNPLAASAPNAQHPTELPAGDYHVAVFENRFPVLSHAAARPPMMSGTPTAAAEGACEVVVFTQDPAASLGRLPIAHISLVLEVWADRYRELGRRPDILYVMPFENRGVEVGVTLHHPHGQIYAYPFIPPLALTEMAQQHAFLAQHGQTLLADFVQRELNEGSRVIYGGDTVTAFVPACARYSYEVWIAPRRAVGSLNQLTTAERLDMARALKTTLLKYDGMWAKPMPYLLVVHQAPTDGADHPEAHLRIEIAPALRSEKRLKFLAGTELGAGMFANDSLPEAKARDLQAVSVDL